MNGVDQLDVAGCTDLDLAFSPATNLLPIRRLSIPIGNTTEVRAAWLGFPEFDLALLEQSYHRIDASRYRYESMEGTFSTELQVGSHGFIFRYPGLWEFEAMT
jgi:hypothetical protein